MIRRVASFLNNRTAALRLDGETGDQEPVKIGVPQGSPVAPILFMLFTAPLFKILTKEDKNAGIKVRGYVDDGLLTSRAQKEKISVAKVQETFIKVETWATENGTPQNLKPFIFLENEIFLNLRFFYQPYWLACKKNLGL